MYLYNLIKNNWYIKLHIILLKKAIISNFKECKIFITVDGNFLCFDHPYEGYYLYKKPSVYVRLEYVTIKKKTENFIELIKKKPGLFLNSVEKYNFRFYS